MLNIVLTGPASDVLGQAIMRADLIAACELSGLTVQPAVRPDTNLVVASRADTVKAKAAAERGVHVMTYPEFLESHLTGVAIPAGGKWDWFTDASVKKATKPQPAGDEGLAPEFVL